MLLPLGIASLLSLPRLVQAQDVFTFPLDFYVGGMQLLAHLLDDSDLYNAVLDHGCHCARLDPFAMHQDLGGFEVIDGLDEITGAEYI